MKRRFFSSLASWTLLFLTVVAAGLWLKGTPNRADRPTRIATVRFPPVQFDPAGFAPLQLAGAWQVQVDDPRFGGISALAVDRGRLLALTDSGSLIDLPKPGKGASARIVDLPTGPGNPHFKANRDSEALVPDPAGRGWWIAFEQWHQLWLYDQGFGRALARIDLGSGRWGDNKGIEAMVADGQDLLLIPERGTEWLRVSGSRVVSHPLASRFGYISDAVRTPDGQMLLVARKMALVGLEKRLVAAEAKGRSLELRSLARLTLGPLDNVEAIAVEPAGSSGSRLWLMTDNDFRRRKRTLLVALDYVPPHKEKGPAQRAEPSTIP